MLHRFKGASSQGIAAVVECLGIVRPHGKSVVVARQRLVNSLLADAVRPRPDRGGKAPVLEVRPKRWLNSRFGLLRYANDRH